MTTATRRHMNGEDAERYLLGNGPDDETGGYEEHLLLCATCRSRVSRAAMYVRSMSDAALTLREGHAIASGDWTVSKVLRTVLVVSWGILLGAIMERYYGFWLR